MGAFGPWSHFGNAKGCCIFHAAIRLNPLLKLGKQGAQFRHSLSLPNNTYHSFLSSPYFKIVFSMSDTTDTVGVCAANYNGYLMRI
jgi:hypothetical protein